MTQIKIRVLQIDLDQDRDRQKDNMGIAKKSTDASQTGNETGLAWSQKTAKRDKRTERRVADLIADGSADAASKAIEIATKAALTREMELDTGYKVTRRERAQMQREMMAGVQAAAAIGNRIRCGEAEQLPADMVDDALTQKPTLMAEIKRSMFVDHMATRAAMEITQQIDDEEITGMVLQLVAEQAQKAEEAREAGDTGAAENQAAANAPKALASYIASAPLVVEQKDKIARVAQKRQEAAIAAMGRPSAFTKEIGDHICQWIQAGKSLNSYITAFGGTAAVIYRWMAENPDFSRNYARAHIDRADTMVEDMLEIADEAAKATDMVQVVAAKLRIDTRKWIAERMRPEKYGAKLEVNQKGQVTFNLGIPTRQQRREIDVTPTADHPQIPGKPHG